MPKQSNDEMMEKLVTVGVQAMHGAVVEQARMVLAKVDLHLDRIKETFETARDEADRSSAILLFALAEDLMIDALKLNLNGDVDGGWKAVIGSNGLLATASDRLMLLEMLRWINKSTALDLRVMKSIRNKFAHRHDLHSYDDTELKNLISSMTKREDVAKAILIENNADHNISSNRALFLSRAIMTITRLTLDLAEGPTARHFKISPNDLAGDFDKRPECFQEAMRFMSEESFGAFGYRRRGRDRIAVA